MSAKLEQSFKKRKKSHSGLIITICIVLTVLIVGSALGIYLTVNYAVNSVVKQADVSVSCTISGNDIIVYLDKGGRSDEVTHIELVMEDFTLPPSVGVKKIPDGADYPKSVTYHDIVAGIYGESTILIKVEYTDCTKSTVLVEKLRLS